MEDLQKTVAAHTKALNELSQSNLAMVQALKKHAQDNVRFINSMETFFRDYVAVAAELTNVPRSVIISRIKEAEPEDDQKTNLFVVR